MFWYRMSSIRASYLAQQMIHRRPVHEVAYAEIMVAHSPLWRIVTSGAIAGAAMWSIPLSFYPFNFFFSSLIALLSGKTHVIWENISYIPELIGSALHNAGSV